MRTPKVRRPTRPDPFDLARAIRGRDLEKLATELWDKKSLPPSWLASRTPHEFAALFFRSPAENSDVTLATAVGQLAATNRLRGDDRQLPLIPPSLLVDLDPRRPKAAVPIEPTASDGFAPLGSMTMMPAAEAPAVRA